MSDTAEKMNEVEEQEEPSSETPLRISLSGAVLGPGDHLLEVELARPAKPEVFLSALKSMGFADVLIDQSTLKTVTSPEPASPPPPIVEDMWRSWREWGHPLAQTMRDEGILRFRFAARVTSPLRLVDTPWVTWIYAQPSSIDLFEDPSPMSKLEPTPLHPGGLYEIRFLARMRAQPTRKAICEALTIMRFRPLKIISLRRNIRLPNLAGTNIALWYALARWQGPHSYVSAEDPFFFEAVRRIG